MSGRPKQNVFQYDTNGKFIKSYECINDARKRYYFNDKGKRPMFTEKDYHVLPDNTYLVTERIGRDAIKLLVKKSKSEFIKINEEKTIKLFNLDNREIARFASISIAHKLTNIPISTIFHQVNDGKGFTKTDLIFKYE